MAYKIINGHVILEPSMMPKFQYQRPVRQCNVGSKNKLEEPQSRLDVTARTFFYETPKLWNTIITQSQANSPSIDAFKSQLRKRFIS